MADRAVTLAALQRELRAARDAREEGYAARLEAEIAKLSAGTPAHPRRERAGSRRAPVTRG